MASIINSTTTAGVTVTGDNSGSLQLATNNGTTAVTIDTSQNVGIGLTPPVGSGNYRSLNVGATFIYGNTGLAVAAYNNNADINDKYIITGVASSYTQSSGNHIWYNAASGSAGASISFTERMRITSSGALYIGATSGTGRLYVESDNNVARFVATNNTAGTEVINQINLVATNNATASDYFFIGGINGGGDKVYILGNGNLQNVNNSYGTLSDIKLKENIVDATPKLDDVMQLKVRNFNLKTDPSQKQIGFVAQELETIFPSIIEEISELDKDKKFTGEKVKGIKTTVLIPVLVKAIQELNAKVDAQAVRIAELEGAK
jgi:hypothetical protein